MAKKGAMMTGGGAERGQSSDPEIRRLTDQLCYLVGEYWSSRRARSREEIVQEYHTIMAYLYELGWDDILDIECLLRDEDMPAEYLRRVGSSHGWLTPWSEPKQQSIWLEYWEWLTNRFKNLWRP